MSWRSCVSRRVNIMIRHRVVYWRCMVKAHMSSYHFLLRVLFVVCGPSKGAIQPNEFGLKVTFSLPLKVTHYCCWFRNPAITSWYAKYPHYGFLYIPGGSPDFLKHQQIPPQNGIIGDTRFRPSVRDVQVHPRWSYNALSSWERLGHSKIPAWPQKNSCK